MKILKVISNNTYERDKSWGNYLLMLGGMDIRKFYTAKYDIVFKAIFCNEDNFNLLIALLSSILEIEIKKLQFLNNELKITYIGERRKIVDLFVLVNDKYVHRSQWTNCL